ncbi:hypothetical protein AAG570_002633 [Ranatra chinensis]|uniref:Uncharacterized protein n=1 Tax=Ranatra chinensis TaxID=642074 RepID=A0ABD0Y856_9HEMI
MASKRRNTSYQNKKQETTEIEGRMWRLQQSGKTRALCRSRIYRRGGGDTPRRRPYTLRVSPGGRTDSNEECRLMLSGGFNAGACRPPLGTQAPICIYIGPQVQVYWGGWVGGSAGGRDPATGAHGDFWLLGVPPGPVRPSLADLGTPGSPGTSMSMATLARTPTRRGPAAHSHSSLQTVLHTRPPGSWITGVRHGPRSREPPSHLHLPV